MIWRTGTVDEANRLLTEAHYLGPMKTGKIVAVIVGDLDDRIVAAQIWKLPTSRRLPFDGTWLELARWCLVPDAGPNAGSRQHKAALPTLRALGATTLVSYSDPSVGHTGALYRACNWIWAPTWQRLRPPPSGNGKWKTDHVQSVKDRWVFHLTPEDKHRDAMVITDRGALRHWQRTANPVHTKWATISPYMTQALAKLS